MFCIRAEELTAQSKDIIFLVVRYQTSRMYNTKRIYKPPKCLRISITLTIESNQRAHFEKNIKKYFERKKKRIKGLERWLSG